MNKRAIAILAIIGISVVILSPIKMLFKSDEPIGNQPLQGLQAQDGLPLNAASAGIELVALQQVSSSGQAVQQTTSDGFKAATHKMEYAADWCIAAIDLTQTDNLYYQEQLQDWRLSTGGITGANTDQFGNTYLSDSSYPLIPYLEADYDDLWSQISKDNEFAMLAVLNRQDIDMTSQQKIAQQLVVKGHTGKALTYLVNFELVYAGLNYRRAGEINAEVKSNLYRALIYTAYGIEHYDLSAAFSYLNMLSSEEFPAELKPVNALGDRNNLSTHLQEFARYIDTMRTNLNLPITADTVIPKAVKHNFDGTLSRLYLDYDNELIDLKRLLPDTAGTMLARSDCVTRQVEFFRALAGKRLSK